MIQEKNRREILKGTAAALVATQLAGELSAEAQAADGDFDVIVVGSGAGGMTAALTAKKRGLKVLVIEKSPKFGGSSARSGGAIWVRNNSVIKREGVPDSQQKAAQYMASLVGNDVPAERQAAFLANGAPMLDFVMRHTPLRFRFIADYSEYYPENPGGLGGGSSVEADPIDGKILGDELDRLNDPYIPLPPGIVPSAAEFKWLTLVAVSAKGVATAAKAAARYTKGLLLGQKLKTMGQALIVGLRKGLLDAGIPLSLNTALVDLSFDANHRVDGVIVAKDGKQILLRAKLGVIMASGGFDHNLAMRKRYQEAPIGTTWTVGHKGNTGDGILIGERAGAELQFMDEAWWGPMLPLPERPYFILAERTLPHSLMVNSEGQRFVNEAAPYPDVVKAMYANKKNEKDVGVWLITDQTYRNRYLFATIPPLLPLPHAWFDAGSAFKSWSLEGLAEQIGVPAAALEGTVNRFNHYADAGVDPEFARGASVYDHYYSDPSVNPNPSLGKLEHGPYYAFRLQPGDLGTKGGLLTDARARVLRPDGSVIEGLYAAGNVSASVTAHSYPANGATLGPAMTFGYIAANDIADERA